MSPARTIKIPNPQKYSLQNPYWTKKDATKKPNVIKSPIISPITPKKRDLCGLGTRSFERDAIEGHEPPANIAKIVIKNKK
jgi:hypothetical protein